MQVELPVGINDLLYCHKSVTAHCVSLNEFILVCNENSEEAADVPQERVHVLMLLICDDALAAQHRAVYRLSAAPAVNDNEEVVTADEIEMLSKWEQILVDAILRFRLTSMESHRAHAKTNGMIREPVGKRRLAYQITSFKDEQQNYAPFFLFCAARLAKHSLSLRFDSIITSALLPYRLARIPV